MRKLFSFFAILACSNVIAGDTSPITFYKDIVNSINNVQGTVLLSLGDGLWEKKFNNTDVIWRNDPNTIATFSFSYQGGNLQKSSYLAFSPAVHIWVRNTTTGLSLAIDTIYFNQIGGYLRWHTHYDNLKNGVKNPPVNPNELDKIQSALSADLRVNNMFQGKLFTNYLSPTSVTEKLQLQASTTPFFKQIYFLSTGDNPALAIDFNKGATIHFSKRDNGNLYDNAITLSRNNNSNVKFSYIMYDFLTNSLKGRLSEFNANLESGSITTGTGMYLTLLPTSRLNFNEMEFQNTDQFTYLDCSSGSLTAGIGPGSKINLTTGVQNPSYLVFDNNSTINLAGFALNIHDKKATDILISGGSTVSLNVRDAQFGIGQDGYITLGAGQLNANLNGDWNSSSRPDADLQITNLNATISGGKFVLNKSTNLSLVSGSIKSTELLLKGLSFQGLTGKITDFNVFFQEGSTFALPNGLSIVNGSSSSSFIGATPNDPMILEQSYPYPLSKYSFNILFKTFQNSNSPIFGLQNGNVSLNFQNFDIDSIAITNSSIGGQFDFESSDAKIKGWCSVYNIQGYECRGLPQMIAGKMKLNVYPGLSYDIHTPFVKGPGGDERTFPLNFMVNTHDSILSSEGDIAFKGRILTIANLKYSANLELNVPAGGGEHQDPDDPNSAHNTDPGDDQMRAAQEVYRDHNTIIGPTGCTFHIYLLPYTYHPTAQFYVQTDENNSVSLSLTHVTLNEELAEDKHFKKDGCSGGVIGAIFGAVIGSLTGGAGGAIVLGIVGDVAGNSIESSIKKRMLSEIANKIESEKGTWKLISF